MSRRRGSGLICRSIFPFHGGEHVVAEVAQPSQHRHSADARDDWGEGVAFLQGLAADFALLGRDGIFFIPAFGAGDVVEIVCHGSLVKWNRWGGILDCRFGFLD